MNAPHTAGTWVFLEEGRTEEDGNACKPLTICSQSGDDLASVYSSDDSTASVPRAEAVANARLMACAPALIAALIGLDEAFCSLSDNMTREERHDARLKLIAARAAVAKAKGEVPA